MTKLIFWNCRGAGKLASRAYLQELARIHHPVAIVLLETRHTSFTRRNIDRLIGREWDYEVVPSSGRVGNSGGILFLWRGDCISVSNVAKHKYFLTASILIPGGLMWQFAAVYADKDMHRRRVIWEELAKLDSNVPTIIGGDFNCVLREEEKRGGAPFNAIKGPEEFASFITSNNLHEIPFTGNIFTWCNNQDISTRKISRLDRVLLNAEACIAFPASVVHHLARIGSDHAPLLLELDKMQFTSSRSRQKFEEVWLTKPNVHHVALGAWSKPVSGHPSRVLALKCSRTINALAKWSKFNAKKESEEARNIEKDIKELQLLEGSRVLLESELLRLRLLVAKYNEVQGKLDAWWWQRAKSNWLAHGDRNSAFFQAAATQRKHENRIFMLQRNDEAITDQAEIEKEITKHFSIRWQLKDCTDGSSLPTPCNFVSESEAQILMTPPTDKEIKNAVFSFGSNKAPGYDGVTHSFFTNFWGFTMVEIIEAVKDFFATCKMEKSWKDTLIMLIPKCSQATLPEHYRPISLCSSIYKVVAKIITSRLKPLLCRLISGEQAAFVPGRLLSDNCIMAQEILHRMHSTESKAGYMAIKIDMEKAFDRMQWSFVRRALEAFKFPADWINLIMECISSPRFGILINGVRSTWIEATCGLRQGCPLSPYLFILCSEFLSLLIRRSEHPGIGIKVCASAQKISHLLYADDTLLFGAATPSTAREFYFILQRYCSFSGEAVNASKSNVLFGPKVPPAAKETIYQLLGHSEVKALSYLGIKLRPGRVKRADFDNLINQVACKARCWGSRHLSMAGRVALINSTLAAIPQHTLANTPMPVSVLNKINSMLKNFLWVGARSEHAIHYARWDDVCTPKQQGGLGIKNLIIWRRVMMGKVAARVLASENTLLASTLGSKYGGPNLFKQHRNHSKIWKTICLGKKVVEKHTMWQVGDGAKIATVTDTWIGALPIALWPTFVDAATLPKYLKEGLDENGAWTSQFLSKFGPALADFISRLPRVDGGGPDKLVWAHSECRKMNAAAVYAAECQPNDLVGGDFWKLKSQPRMLMLFWRALNSQLPTYKWLKKHHLKDAASCPWGCSAEESISHIFGSCKFISKVWRECDRMNIKIKPSNASMLLYINGLAEHSRDSFEAKFLLSLIYNIWKARNSKVHGENFLQPASIVIAALHDSCHGSWNVQCNPQSTWTSPPIGWIKVNFDGSVRPNNVAGLGCVIRSHTGEFIAASGTKSYSRSVDMTEFRSACVGLNLAKPFFNSCTGIILEGDSSMACSRLNRILEGMYTGENERRLALTLKDAPRVVVSNIGRLANGAADHVANLACEDDVAWERGMPLPHSLSVLLLHDSDAL